MNTGNNGKESLAVSLRDDSRGYSVTPKRVPLAALREFARDVDDFFKGEDGEVQTQKLDVSILEGSLVIQPHDHLVAPRFFHDIAGLAQSEIIDLLDKKRREVIDRWQKRARASRGIAYVITSYTLDKPVVINSETDFRLDDADNWVRVERYLNGEIEDLGGSSKSNAHLRLPNGELIRVETSKSTLRDEKVNRLYKPSMIRFRADFNIVTQEYRNAVLIEFVDYSPKFDEEAFGRLTERGRAAWSDVNDPSEWVESQRGSNN
jgi:hypothetical protein